MAEANPNSLSGAHEPRVATFTDSLDAVRRSLDALHYLNTLLDLATFHDGGALADPRSGLSQLMGRHLEDIDGALEVLRAAKPDMLRPAPHDIEAIAARARVHRDEAARVIFVLTGKDHEGPSYRAWDGDPHQGLPAHLLASHIWNTLSHGDVWGQVSTATGVDLLDLKRILDAMLTYAPRRNANALAES